MSINDNLNLASSIIAGFSHYNFYKIYPFTTENINGYLSKYDLNNSSVLTVGSSADQVINSYLLGANNVTLFDVNPFCKYFYELKCAAIKALSIDEFLTYFCYYNYPKSFTKNKYSFNYPLYLKISKYLSGEAKVFWDTLYSKFSPLSIRKRLFNRDENLFRVVLKTNDYLKEDNFNKLKKNILDFSPTFIQSDVRDICTHLKEKYDYILLSNIACFMEGMYDNVLLEFRKNMLLLKDFLNNDGVMFMAYLYDTKKDTIAMPHWDLIYHLDIIFNLFIDQDLSLDNFTGIKGLIHDSSVMQDAVLTLKK